MAVFMDVEGAFSHTSPHIICEEAASRGVPRPIVDWMPDLLGTRRITSTLGSYRCSGTVSMGTPQGGVTSPLDWNMMAGGLLRLLNGEGCYAQAYVDDFAAVTVSSDLGAAVNLMQCMLRKVTTWCTETGRMVNPDKTDLVVFTRKHKVPTFTPRSLAGKKLGAEDSAKYLEVILDRKLNWNEHLEDKIRKFHAAF